MRLPDFIIAGAPRSGTTWLYELLDRHPDIYMAKPVRPEPKFFLVDETYAKGLDFYSATWFAGVDASLAAGEKSTNYLESPLAAARIHEHLPSVKLVFILREPADRAISNYRWSVMNGIESEPVERALALEDERELATAPEHRYSRPFAYFSRGLYAEHLESYFERFPSEQILCLKYEHIHDDAALLATRLHGFLGVEPRPDDVRDLGIINSSNSVDACDVIAVRDRLRERYAAPNLRLGQLLGADFDVWSYT